jgi:hypothetical protein
MLKTDQFFGLKKKKNNKYIEEGEGGSAITSIIKLIIVSTGGL